MKKDAYYFPHFCNARNDRRIKRVKKELGIEGYAIFFMLLETLREQTDFRYPMDDIDLLADEYGTSEQKLRTVVCNYGLFIIEAEKWFYSPKLIEYLKPYLDSSKRARNAALIRWNNESKQGDNAGAMQMHSKCYASKVKKSKVKEKKIYGTFSNVRLSDDELAKLKKLFPSDYLDRINSLSEYLQSKGKRYKDHYATILSWDRKDKRGRNDKPEPVDCKRCRIYDIPDAQCGKNNPQSCPHWEGNKK